MILVCTQCNKNENLSVWVEDVGLVLFVPQRNEWVQVDEDDDFDDNTGCYVIPSNATVIDISNFSEDEICCDCIEDYTTVEWV